MVVADQHALARIFAAHNIPRERMGDDARVRKRKIFGNNAAPAVGSKFDRRHERKKEVYAKGYVL